MFKINLMQIGPLHTHKLTHKLGTDFSDQGRTPAPIPGAASEIPKYVKSFFVKVRYGLTA
jgi:hypothetical protein